MNGAESLVATLVASGVDTCFMNPGTSEMHFVAALDSVPEMRGVLTLFEGVASGAADGYARMAGRPAATLFHLGPGLGNAIANLHNARRASTPMVNVVGDHATHHRLYDAPLASDIDALASNVSSWIRTPETPSQVAVDAAEAVAAAMGRPNQIATVILPADSAWLDADGPAPPSEPTPPATVDDARVDEVASVLLSGEPAGLLLGHTVLEDADALRAVGAMADATGCRPLGIVFPRRVTRGPRVPEIPGLGYFAEQAAPQLAGLRHLVLVDAPPPATFFAYPGQPSDLVPEGCEVHVLASAGDDSSGAVAALADRVGAGDWTPGPAAARPDRPTGSLTGESIAAAVGATLPEGAIVVNEAATNGFKLLTATAGAPAHDWLTLTGGAIGAGMPLATGAALACPERPVLNLEADGSSMYTCQALWTQAREGLDVTTVIFNNRSYDILNIELARVGAATDGTRAAEMLHIGRPDLDFVRLGESMGVPSERADAADDLAGRLERAMAEPGPHLVEVAVPSLVG